MKTHIKYLILLLPLYLVINAFVLPATAEYDYIPIVHFDKQPIIEGWLNGKKAYFMLDSGSQLSLLNSREAASFEFEVSMRGPQGKHANGIGGTGGRFKYAHAYKLGLGMQDSLDIDFLAYDLSHVLDEKNGITPVGIIGGDMMKAYGFQIDFKNKIVRLRKLNQHESK